MEWKGKIAKSLLEGFRQCYTEDIFTDIEIEVNDAVFKCHKVFLCSMSDFFHAMFLSGMRESVNNRVQLSGLTSATFRDVLTFYYEGDDSIITHDTVEELLRASGLLQLECLQERCEVYYADHLYPENAIGIWKLAKCLGCKQLQEKAKMYVLTNFSSVSEEAEFLSLDCDLLLEVIGDSDLKVPCEDKVCMAAISWVKHDLTARSQHLDSIVANICLHVLSPACYSNLVAFAQFTCASCSTHLQDCLDQRRLPLMQPQASTSAEMAVGKRSRNHEEMLVVIGVHKATKMLPAVHAYSFALGQWYRLDALPFDPGVGYATCVKDSTIYMSGISLRRGYMLRYDEPENYWHQVSEMPDRRRYHEMVVVDGYVYVVGGCNKRDGAFSLVTRYNMEEDRWTSAGHLQLGVYSASATAIRNTVLVFGGRAHGNIRRHEVQAYNTSTCTASIVNTFSSPVTESKALTLGDEAFIVLTNGAVMKVSEDGTVYPVTSIPNFDRYNFGLVRKMNTLMVVGGETRYPSSSGSGHFADFIRVDPETRKTSVLSDSMFVSASAACCCLVILRRTRYQKLAVPPVV